jgi:hypothetical protein
MARTAWLQLDFSLVWGFGLQGALGFGMGLSFEASGVLGSAFPVSLSLGETPGCISGLGE